MDTLKSEVLGILKEQGFVVGEEQDLEINLFESNRLDSINIVELIAAFEEKFAIEFEPNDILGANWYSANVIIETVRRKISKD